MADRSFGPTVLAGVLGAALAAATGHQRWVTLTAPGTGQGAVDWFTENNPGLGEMPAAGALGLVALASWGVVLVSRGRWRRAVAGMGLLATVGIGVAWVVGALSLRDDVRDRAGVADLATAWEVEWSAAFVLAGLSVLLLLPAHVVAVLRAPRWPEMGGRYDAPASRAAAAPASEKVAAEEGDPADLWRAIDEGRDPTL
ncbi:Trp biosynthesis-associated membrane protein [Nocardioides sp. Y6]|uniref:Trp biosynthesis-associated membrane protein n=1 Tax=Nocardioides malaquae TaxID=2773426 RepID=A0ABR9RNQ3_9ACTN|nr:Trp biosynthesis-associated membrane protein [Nocardioides malaquae]MBE7323201.1 Trp biosynthesis-associated membrane protein [Nocardioides malaquae]